MPDPTDSLRWPAYPWNGPSYVLQGTCGNCDRTALVTVARGHEAPSYRNGPECPYCGCSRWVGLRAPEDAPEKDMPAGLRAAAKIPHAPIDDDAPPEDAVEELAQVLCETAGYLWLSQQPPGATCVPVPWGHASHDLRVHYRAMARAALASIGGREVALEAALHTVKAECDIYISTHHASCMCGACASWRTSDAALSLPRSAAAEAVRELVEAAREALNDFGLVNEAIASQVMPGLHPFTLTPRDLRVALRPFNGEGDA